MTLTRDIRLTADEIITLRDLCSARVRVLEKRLEKNSYTGKPGMLNSVLNELSRNRELYRTFGHAREQLARQLAHHILGDKG